MDLKTYDWVVINSSAGKDSQAMLDVLVALADEQGVPRERLVVVHADLSDEEWAGTKELAATQAAHYGLRFEVVKRKQGGILKQVLERHAKLKRDGKDAAPWPDSVSRYCTSSMKRETIAKLLTQLAKEHRDAHGKKAHCRILNCLGMRAGESSRRAKLRPFENNKKQTNGRRTVDTWLPIFDLTVDQVWEHIHASGVPFHYAYNLGMPRLSCCFCVFAPREALMLAGKHNPELLDRYVEVEQEVGYTFTHKLSLTVIRDAIQAGEEPGEVKSWEMP